ncbi:MAG: TRAP transporter small permease [Gammaproteobacteria bacterium]|nr:TRAP transporter small permease [Gammaproteobacteria bacterium]MBT8111598.1 TRAP transporter small permease [Gammaproteobacteria bacterium]NND48390.1 TRAP transporter small permease [Woeseiaceae bacterium]NNL46296.1 TRAP transporter small permease [Woeseiaceae bacterium]
MYYRFIALLERLERAGRFLETAALVMLFSAMMLLAVGQIILREIFNTGFVWADELIKLMVLWLAMVGSIAAARENRHIRIDALSHVLPELGIQVIRIIVDLFAGFVCGVIAWQAWLYLQVEIEYADTVLVNIPAWIAHSIMPAAFLLISFRFVVLVVKQIGAIVTRPLPGSGA